MSLLLWLILTYFEQYRGLVHCEYQGAVQNSQIKKPNFLLKLLRYELGEKTESSWEAISLG